MSQKVQAERLYNHVLDIVQQTMGSGITTNFQLDDYLGRVGPWYQGAFARTPGLAMITALSPGEGSIINTTDEGEHWVAVYRFKSGVLSYDSFGRSFEELFNARGLEDTEDDAEQALLEDNSGQRCIAWLLICKLWGSKMAKWI
jgi:hypothetical protein